MARQVAIGEQDFVTIQEKKLFYVDKTNFIKDWWENSDSVTLLCRPRRFGKTLTMSMLNAFFSNRYENRGDLFEGLKIWQDEAYRKLQGTYPVINLTFSAVKESRFEDAKETIGYLLKQLFNEHAYLLGSEMLTKGEKETVEDYCRRIPSREIKTAVDFLSGLLQKHFGKKALVLLDEYDTPMLEAYHYGYWDEMVDFLRMFFNFSFKANTHMERALMTGITRIAHENLFSDFNNPMIVTMSTEAYETAIGFTEEEVFDAMAEQGIPEEKREEVRAWYDGFVFGKQSDMYNPWSIINYLREKKVDTYWINTSSNGLVERLLQPKREDLRDDFERLLRKERIVADIDERMIFQNLDTQPGAVWTLLYSSGYLKALTSDPLSGRFELAITNGETWYLFRRLVKRWFAEASQSYNDFQKALLAGDVTGMNRYLSAVLLRNTSFYDGGKQPGGQEPERFYHGLVLGMITEFQDRYEVLSNGESGKGRYDIMLKPKAVEKDLGIVIEFKLLDRKKGEKTLEDTVQEALRQIREKNYDEKLLSAGVPREHIRRYGFAFEGKEVLIKNF